MAPVTKKTVNGAARSQGARPSGKFQVSQPVSSSLKTSHKKYAAESGSGGKDEVYQAPILQQRIRTVSKTDITSKWEAPSDKIQQEIQDLLRDAERATITRRFRKDNERVEAQRATQKLVAKLQNRAAKLPLPTVGKDFSLSYESIIERTMHSEALLQPLLRQNAELEKELEKERLALERDEEDLKELQANAKSQEMVRAQQVRTLPKTLRAEPEIPVQDGTDDIHLSILPELQQATYRLDQDAALLTAVNKLHKHLNSMQTNTGALEELPELVPRGRAAVEEVLIAGGFLGVNGL